MAASRPFNKVAQSHASEARKQYADVDRQILLKRRWQSEQVFAYLRWGAFVVWAIATLLFASAMLVTMLAIGLLLGIGNTIAWLFLRNNRTPRRLRVTQCIATGATWIGAIGAVTIGQGRIATFAPGVFLVLIAVAGMRFRVRGTVAATGVASACTAVALTKQAWSRDDLDFGSAAMIAAAWVVLFTLMGIVTGVRSRLSDAARFERAERLEAERDQFRCELEDAKAACIGFQRELEHRKDETARFQEKLRRREVQLFKYRRERHKITEREWEVLELVIDGMTYPTIAKKLSISRDTVKTHVRKIGKKLGTSGGRQGVTSRAMELNLFPPDPPI